MKLLLHACCGPCSLEPVRLLQEAGHSLTIYYTNSNIAPEEEYQQRLDTLLTWAHAENIPVIEGTYHPAAWEETAGMTGEALLAKAQGDAERCATEPALREARCRLCYRLRFQEAAEYASQHHFDALGTTLSVSPYQFTQVIEEELERAATQAGVAALFQDYRPYYDEATRRSRQAGMYRQNYCGCRFSDAEAAAERALRKREREQKRAAKRAAQAEEQKAAEAARAARREERAAYDQKQAQKRAVLKALREKNDS